MSKFNSHRLARCGLVTALYVVLCLMFQPLSFGGIQVRFAEALTLLPIFGAEYIPALVLGCFLSNLLGSVLPDVIFGTIATLLACLLTYKMRNLRWKGLAIPAALPPILVNALIVGPEIAIFFLDTPATLPLMAVNALTVGLGEVISCGVLGVALVHLIERTPALRRLFIDNKK